LTKQSENPPEELECSPFTKDTSWTISCYSNQLVAQLQYLNTQLIHSDEPKYAREMIKLVRQYKKRLKQLVSANKDNG